MRRLLRHVVSALLIAWPAASIHAQTLQQINTDFREISAAYPTPAQAVRLNNESALAAPSEKLLHDNKLTFELSPNALLLIKVQP